jgi:NADPH-dependent 2,4-dienoyl-CoA reductase/sulfur reductase-like enzyme
VAEALSAEVAVAGAGPAGIAAACAAAEAGRRVVLIDEGPRAGGQVWRHRAAPPRAARRWLERLARAGVTCLDQAGVFDAEGHRLRLEREGAAVRVEWQALVVATGARERFLPFPGWTLPGAIGVGAAQALLKAGASFAGRRVIVAGSGPLLLAVAAALREEGAALALVAEQAPFAAVARFAAGLWRDPLKLRDGVSYRVRLGTTPYRAGTWVTEAHGHGRVEAATLTDGRRAWREPCDVLCCAYGLEPNLELPRLLGCDTPDGAVAVDEFQATSVADVFAAGETSGVAGVEQALVTGEIAGLAAAGRREQASALFAKRLRGRAFAARLARAFALRPELDRVARRDTIVCRCEDVPLARVRAASTRREAKLRSRAGMGACQGRICGAALERLGLAGGESPRPPLVPVPLGLLEDEA